ncbi:hypothetical protein [Spirosoma fluminis]
MSHSAHNSQVEIEFRVSASIAQEWGESEFQILLFALDSYREKIMGLMEQWRNETDSEIDHYRIHANTVQTINQMSTQLALNLCLAHQQNQSPKTKV